MSAPSNLHLGEVTVSLVERRVTRGEAALRLGKREAEVLTFLARRRGAVVPRERLLVEVFGRPATDSGRAVDALISRLRRKIETDPAEPRFLRTVYGKGYTLDWESTEPPTEAAEATPAPTLAPPPAETGPFLGRDTELGQLRTWLGRERPGWLTLVGPGGIGKTRLATALASDPVRLDGRPTAWVTLRGIPGEAAVVAQLAHATGAGAVTEAKDPWTALARAWEASRLFVVLDNLEPFRTLFHALTRLAGALEHAAVLATSRLALNAMDERRLLLGGLATQDAVALATQTAARVGAALSDADVASLGPMLDAADGLPLAAELAAVSLRRGGRSLPTVVGGLGATTWALLTVPEREALATLSTLQTPFGTDTADALLGGASVALGALDEHGLLRWQDGRAQMHPVIATHARGHATPEDFDTHRAWARARLDALFSTVGSTPSAVDAAMTEFEAAWALAAERRDDDALGTLVDTLHRAVDLDIQKTRVADMIARVGVQDDPLDALDRQLAILDVRLPTRDAVDRESRARALLTTCDPADHARLRLAQVQALRDQARLDEAREHVHAMLARADDRWPWLDASWRIDVASGRYAEAAEAAEAAVAHADTPDREAASLYGLGVCEMERFADERAQELLQRALGIAQRIPGAAHTVQGCHVGLGHLARRGGQLPRAERHLRRVLELEALLGDDVSLATALYTLGLVLRDKGDLTGAKDLLEQCLALGRSAGFARGVANALSGLGGIAFARDDLVLAARRFQEVLEVFGDEGELAPRSAATVNVAMMCWAGGRSWEGAPALDRLLASGEIDQWPILHAVATCLSACLRADLDRSPPDWSPLATLEGRDQDGMTDFALTFVAGALLHRGHLDEANRIVGHLKARPTSWQIRKLLTWLGKLGASAPAATVDVDGVWEVVRRHG